MLLLPPLIIIVTENIKLCVNTICLQRSPKGTWEHGNTGECNGGMMGSIFFENCDLFYIEHLYNKYKPEG